MLTKQQATKGGGDFLQLVKSTIGGDWKMNVWENFGWHYMVYLGGMALWENLNIEEPTYHAMIEREFVEEITIPSSTPVQWSDDKSNHSTPKKALDSALAKAQSVVDKEVKVLSQNKNLLP